MISTPLGTLVGGPLVALLGAAPTLTASGAATILLAVGTGLLWTRQRQPSSGTWGGEHVPQPAKRS